MRKFASIILVLALCLCLQAQAFATPSIITTPATGYTCAEDVEHKIIDGIVVNWGARGETCSFLSPSALNYYYALDTDTWEELSQKDGGTGTSNAYTSELYKALQQLMTLRHTNIQGYQATRPYYMYTDCANNDQTLISSFYSGKTVASTWNGQSYNREHVWPNSKCINTNKANDSADIMMLRATISSENSSRGNTAYGESRGYFDPGAAVRGDCARMVLYGYVRWGNTGKMWGTSGVMENLDILLKWMEEDPVDTWEMGRNDSVQSITGVRNVFVDYPEFAWMLFGRDIPAEMATPSGNAAVAPHKHNYTASVTAPTCTADGYTTYTCTCGNSYTAVPVAATGHSWDAGVVTQAPTETTNGELLRTCANCGQTQTESIPALEHTHNYTATVTAPTCTEQGYTTYTCSCGQQYMDTYTAALGHTNTEIRGKQDATCKDAGYTGDTYCLDCDQLVQPGETTLANGVHKFSDWVSNEQLRCRTCIVCSFEEVEYFDTPSTKPDSTPVMPQGDTGWLNILIVSLILAAFLGAAIFIVKGKRK